MIAGWRTVDPRCTALSIFQLKMSTRHLALLVVGGDILLPILVITTLLRKSINKHPVYLNFRISWILFSIADTILFVLPRYISTACTDIVDMIYRTRNSDFDLTGLYSSITLCYVQASLSNGVQALWVYGSHRRSVLVCWSYVYTERTSMTTLSLVIHVNIYIHSKRLLSKDTHMTSPIAHHYTSAIN